MNGYLKLLIALLAAMTISGLLNVIIERLAYRPCAARRNWCR